MQTPEEFLGALEMAYADANRDRDICPSGTRVVVNRGAQAAADLILARDASREPRQEGEGVVQSPEK